MIDHVAARMTDTTWPKRLADHMEKAEVVVDGYRLSDADVRRVVRALREAHNTVLHTRAMQGMGVAVDERSLI